jgi:hypothetical protein
LACDERYISYRAGQPTWKMLPLRDGVRVLFIAHPFCSSGVLLALRADLTAL